MLAGSKPVIVEITMDVGAQILETPVSAVNYAVFTTSNLNESISKTQANGEYIRSSLVYAETTENGEIILYHRVTKKYYYINPVLASFWRSCGSYSNEAESYLLSDCSDAISYLVEHKLLYKNG